MSLTSHLANPTSPIGQFFRERFPYSAPIIIQGDQKLRAIHTLRPNAPGENYPWRLVGQALDYRLRYAFAVTPSERLVAKLGASVLCGRIRDIEEDGKEAPAPYAPALIDDFFTSLDTALARIAPAGRTLPEAEERELARYCFVLACLDEPARDDRWKQGPLMVPTVKHSAAEWLAIPGEEVIDDLCRLWTLFFARYGVLLTRPYFLNPTFAGSHDVGGADADVIVSTCLIDLKTTTWPNLKRDWLHQLLGYVLLDYDDKYHLEWVALYMARQGKLLAWKLADILPIMVRTEAVSLPALREELQAVIQRYKQRRTYTITIKSVHSASETDEEKP